MDLYRLTPNNCKRYNRPAIIENQKESSLTIKRYCYDNGIFGCLFYKNKAWLYEFIPDGSTDSQMLFVPTVLADRTDVELSFMIDAMRRAAASRY